MHDALGYQGRSVIVTGAASGMGEATARILTELGASVTAIDIKPPGVQVARAMEVDLRDRTAIDKAVAGLDGSVHALFSCAGLPGPPFSELDTVLVNFVGARHLAMSVVAKMGPGSSINAISSSAGAGWQEQMKTLTPLLETADFEAAVAWLDANQDSWSWSGYLFSKWALDAWVGWVYPELAGRGIRVNCTNPGPTETAMMPAFHDFATKEVVDQSVGPIGRYASAEEQAWPLVLLGSARMSYVAGEVLWVDGGWNGARSTGRQRTRWTDFTAKQ